MKKINQINLPLKTAQSFLTEQPFVVYKDDYITQGKILDNMKQAQDKCYELTVEVIQKNGWKKPEKLEDLFYLLQEKGVIGSDLVDKMIAIYRLRWGLIEDNLEKDDYKLVHEILKQNFEDMNLFIKQVREFVCTADSEEKKYQSFDGGGFTICD